MAGHQQCNLEHLLLNRSYTQRKIDVVEAHILSGACANIAHHSFKDLMKREEDLGYSNTLLDACMLGNFEDVRRIIEVWRIDIETPATLFINPILAASRIGLEADRLLGVTPLFVAALKNDVKLVRYLVGKGANVSARTSTENKGPFAGITPLHAALLWSRSQEAKSSKQTEVIRILLEFGADPSALSSDGTPIWMFGWLRFYRNNVDFSSIGFSNSSTISLLLEYGMSIDQRCPRLDRTLLHHMAGPANIGEEIINLIVEKGANIRVRDKEGITPILSAAIGNNQFPNMLILKFFMEKDDIPNTDKIEALEVAAALLPIHPSYYTDIEYCLSRAQELRKIEWITLIPETPSNERAVEWATSSNLEKIQQRRSEFGMQSFLIRLRTFSALSWGAIYRYLWPYFDCHCLLIPAEGSHQELAEMLDMSWAMLETISRFAPDVEKTIPLVLDTVVGTLIDTLCTLEKKNDPLFNAETIKTSFKLLSRSLQAQSNCGSDDRPSRNIKSLGKMFRFLVKLPEVMIQPISHYLEESVRLNNQDSNQEKLIISACLGENDNIRELLPHLHVRLPLHLLHGPSLVNNTLAFFRFLLRFGADADAVDGDGNGPLQFIAAMPDSELTNALALLLLDAGAHLDRANKDRLTAADVWKQKRQMERKMRFEEDDDQAVGWQDFPIWLRGDVPMLMCLSAQTIRSQRIPYLKVLPPKLKYFVSSH